ncbi:hypothetical protein [Thermomonas sp.]|uniref:hypothetical protein n=1 Tax=Thermomonas sp. TaxID=1971895 RepID=UPI002489FD15|nr:hypothetical protein [Thermomonas sp.]MDI1252491.1 hypothetical protein [Thermomonas sp.]
MKLFNFRTLRSTTFVVLLVWFFGVASGVANACSLEDREGDHGRSPHGDEMSIGTVGSIDSHRDSSDASRAPCLKFCDDGSDSPVTEHSTIDLADPGHASFVVRAWPVLTTATPVRVVDLSWPPPEQSIRVRFSRLSL